MVEAIFVGLYFMASHEMTSRAYFRTVARLNEPIQHFDSQ